MEHVPIEQLIPQFCPENGKSCMGCPHYGGIEDGMIRCFKHDDEQFNN